MKNVGSARRGFALREAFTLMTLAAVGVALLTPVASYGAGQSRLQVCMSRLKSMGSTSAMFANDNRERIASFLAFSGMSSWRSLPNRVYEDNTGGQQASTADAAVDIIRVRGHRQDIDPTRLWRMV